MGVGETVSRWSRAKQVYTTLAILLLNTVVLLLAVEGIATVINAVHPPRTTLAETTEEYKQRMLRLNYYYTQDWADEYWTEHLQVVDHWYYHAYTVWRTGKFTGHQINVDENGVRVTPGSTCGPDSYRIYLFGGSTMWGFGVPDWATIPAYLQTHLEGRDACIVNRSELGFNSTQSLIDLYQLIQAGDIPDMVVFYDGINDIYAADRANEPGAHYFLENIQPVVKGALVEPEPAGKFLKEWMLRTATARMLLGEPPMPGLEGASEPFDPTFLDGITNIYLTNVQMVDLLADEYDFTFFAFIQPVLPTFDRPDSPYKDEEQAIMWNTPQSVVDLFDAVYPRWQQAVQQSDNLFYFADILDGTFEYPFWIDFNHLTPWGNLIIAHEMAQRIVPAMDAALAQRNG